MPTENKKLSSLFCIRSLLILSNLATLLTGVATTTVGIWLYFQSDYEKDVETMMELSTSDGLRSLGQYKEISYGLMVLGSVVTFVSFVGCFGACVRSSCLLLCYLTTVVLILTLQLMVSIFAIIYREPMSDMFRNELLSTMKSTYYQNKSLALEWDEVQARFHCCGVDGYSDWFYNDMWPEQKFVPDSCCFPHVNITDCGKAINPTLWYSRGCLGQMQLWVLGQVHILASIIIALVFLQLYGIISSILLFYNSRSPKNPNVYKSYPYERAEM